ncbi:MAG TPA: hypothetical protein VFV50_02625 [Bdellovibrionales bacterium]|nr:hypothetical protein [Bdellovibrionales bacterium]
MRFLVLAIFMLGTSACTTVALRDTEPAPELTLSELALDARQVASAPARSISYTDLPAQAAALQNARQLETMIADFTRDAADSDERHRLIVAELKLLSAFKGIRRRLNAIESAYRFNADDLFRTVTGIDFDRWSRNPAVRRFLDGNGISPVPALRSELEFSQFLGTVAIELRGVAAILKNLRDDNYPSAFCVFTCTGAKSVSNLHALAVVASWGAKISFVKGYDLHTLFTVNQRVDGRLLRGRPLTARDNEILRLSRSLFRLFPSGAGWVAQAYWWSNQYVKVLERELDWVSQQESPDPAKVASLQIHYQILKGEKIPSRSGAIYHASLPDFYRNPPPDLKAFLPIRVQVGPIERYLPGAQSPAGAIAHFQFLDQRWPGGAPFPLNVFFKLR